MPSRLRSTPCEIDPVLIASSAPPAVTGASPSSPPHWVRCHSGKRELDWARHAVAFLSWRRWRRLTTSDHEPMLRRKDKSQWRQWHAKQMVGSFCQPVNLSTCLCRTSFHMCVAECSSNTKTKNCAPSPLALEDSELPVNQWLLPLEPSAGKKVSASAESSTRACWARHRPTACGLQLPFAAAVATKSSSSLMPAGPTFPYVS